MEQLHVEVVVLNHKNRVIQRGQNEPLATEIPSVTLRDLETVKYVSQLAQVFIELGQLDAQMSTDG